MARRWFGAGVAAVVAVIGLVVGGAATAAAAWSPNGPGHPGAPQGAQVAPATPVVNGGTVGAAAFANHGVLTYGDAPYLGRPTSAVNSPLGGMVADPAAAGYWLFAADGGVFTYGAAGFHGSAGGLPLYAPIVGMAATPDGGGYWLVAEDGGVFAFGDARFYGSMGGHHLNFPVVGMAPTHDGRGYWLVAADGGIFSFGDAPFHGSEGGHHLNAPIVGMAVSHSGGGYWMVAADGGIFTFGDAPFEGSAGSVALDNSVAGMAATVDGKGYWLVDGGGVVRTYGDARFYGDSGSADPDAPIDAIARTGDGKGYWLLEPDAIPVSFSHPASGSSIVAHAASQIRANPDAGSHQFCNPYGPCEEWCALFATWAWESAGVPIPRYAFVGDVYTWAAAHTATLAPTGRPAPGDAVLYGTGPWNVDTAVHMGIVAQVWPNGAVDTIDGDSGPGPWGDYSVTINGPFLPAFSQSVYNGVGIFAYAVP